MKNMDIRLESLKADLNSFKTTLTEKLEEEEV
jgi:hypothetical protein